MVQHIEDKINSRERVRWACRRGMLELDKIIIPFFDENYDSMTKSGQDLFIKLLETSDQKLYDWLFKGEMPEDSRLHDLIMVLRYSNKCTTSESV